jgi:hypothetical protein
MKLSDITNEDVTTLVGLLTLEQKELLQGKWYSPDSYYNAITDINDNWIISVEEMQSTSNPDTMWVKDLNIIEYKPKPTPSPF